jgi:hypothetical protein
MHVQKPDQLSGWLLWRYLQKPNTQGLFDAQWIYLLASWHRQKVLQQNWIWQFLALRWSEMPSKFNPMRNLEYDQ